MRQLNKSELIKKMSEIHHKITQQEMKAIVDSTFSYLTESIISGRRIEIRGFGSFSIKCRKPGKVRNPRYGVTIDSPERKVVYFRAGKELSERANNL